MGSVFEGDGSGLWIPKLNWRLRLSIDPGGNDVSVVEGSKDMTNGSGRSNSTC